MDSKGNFITTKPKDEVVAKYIDYYYFHMSDDVSFSRKFFFYPNYKHALTVYKGSDVSFTVDSSLVNPSNEKNVVALYSVNTEKNFKVELNGVFNKIGIVFNPLGINHFLKQPLGEFWNRDLFKFEYFGSDFTALSQGVFNEPDADKKTLLLDAFFREKYCGFDDIVVKKAMTEILNSNGSVKVEELSDTLGVNRKTLLRLFKKHLCSSVEEYKKLVMFRNALNYSQQMGGDASLTDVALYSLYYDQAHYIKHFKSVTKQSPKTLLSKLTKLGNQEVYWNFED
ncbi:Helix-turn-helix domain protein [compost metagenome]